MKINFDAKKLIPIGAALVEVAYNVLSNKSNELELEKKVEEKVAKALAEQIKKD